MCNCIPEVENQISEFFLKENPDKKVTSVFIQNTAINPISGKTTLCLPVEINYNQETKKGTKQKSKIINISVIYCPFCGEKLKRGE